MSPWAWNVLALLGSAFGYYVSAVVGTLLSVPPSGFAIIWPATAFLISVFLITPPNRWWLCIAGVVPTHFYIAATFQPDAPVTVVLTQIGGNLALALATVVAVRRTGKSILFGTVGSVLTFILVAGGAVPAVVNALILSVHVATGWTDDLWLAWRQWMISGVFPTITIPPVLVLASNGRLTGELTASSRPRLEFALVATLLFAVGFIAYGAEATNWPALFLAPFPLLLWAAVRLGVGGTCASLLAVAIAIITQALRNNGPFSLQSPIHDVVSLQAFLITSSVPLILLAALMDERRRTATLLRQSEARMNVASSSTDTGLWQWEEGTHRLWASSHCRDMFGLADESGLTPFSFLDAVYGEDRARMEAAITSALTSGEAGPAEDYRLVRDGRTQWVVLHMHSQFDDHGMVQLSGVFRDVTDRVLATLEADELRQRLARLKEDERRRIAEELHDSTAQHLVAARLTLFSLRPMVRAEKASAILAAGLNSIDDALAELRTISYLLHAPQLGRVGLCGVLRQYVPGFESRTGIAASLRVSPLADFMPAAQQHAVLRIVQESLSNVHRHAGAKRVSIHVRCIAGNVHLIVSDDGRGIAFSDSEELGNRIRLGVGIPGMAARVQRLGGRIALDTDTNGTSVHVAIPLAGSPGASLQ